MKNTSLIFLLVLLAGSCNVVSAQQKLIREKGKLYIQGKSPKHQINENVVTVKLKDNTKRLPQKYKVQIANQLGYIDLEVPKGKLVEEFVEELKSTNLFELVKFAEYGVLDMAENNSEANGQWYLEHINIYNAWNITMGAPNIKVGIIDSEVDWQHEDIGYGSDNYRNVDPTQGYNYIHMTQNSVSPDNHGTRVAGIIAAKTNNQKGIEGIAGGNGTPGVTIIPFCVITNENTIATNYIDDAIINAVNCGCKIINMSFKVGIEDSQDIDAAIQYAKNNNVTILAASGNDGVNSLAYPASHPDVIAVGSVSKNYYKSSFSSYGNGLDFMAPGKGIMSTEVGNTYGNKDGTSFSVAEVTGIAALMLSVNPDLTPQSVRNILRATCSIIPGTYFSNGYNQEVGYGCVDAYAAVRLAAESISGPTVPCNAATTYSLSYQPTGCTITWSIDNSNFSISPSGTQCVVTYSGITQHSVANLKATISRYGLTVREITKRIVVHSPDLLVYGNQSDIITQYGVIPGFSFTIPESEGEGELAGTNSKALKMKQKSILALKDSLVWTPQPIVMESNALIPSLEPEYGITQINGEADITLYSDWFDGMNVSFFSQYTPTSFSRSDLGVSFCMPPASSITNSNGYYDFVLNCTSDEGCHDFQLYFRVMPNDEVGIGDSEISMDISGSTLYVTFLGIEDDEGGSGLIQRYPWTLSIYKASTGQRVHYSTHLDESTTVDIGNFSSGTYIIKVDYKNQQYTRKFMKS